MTYEELIVFYFRRDCLVVPGPVVTEVYGNKKSSFDDRVAVIVNSGKKCVVGLYEGDFETFRANIDDLTPDIVELYLNRVLLKEKYREVDRKLEEIKKDFE